MHVFATAGHVDHGKSTLVRALTGSDPDRLEEERRRGLSIRLGYCWTTLAGAGEVAFVDVPGHERFLATALSGLGPVSLTMFVVAADDDWMPQAAEHLAALDGLGVAHGVLVVTRSDLADPAPALVRARAELARTSLADVPAVVVSSRTGAGLDELRATLARVAATLPAPDPTDDVRLWVDRRFHVKGSGTVVTGTLGAGTIRAGDALEVDGVAVRVRALESLGDPVPAAAGPARVALDLGGRAPAGLVAGTALLTPGAFEPSAVLDVVLTGPGEPPERPVLHVGSAAVSVHARPLGDGLARLRLDRPLPLRVSDRALLRDPGSRALWGVRVLDPLPPSLSRRGAARARAAQLSAHDGTLAGEVARRGTVRRSVLRRIGVVEGAAGSGGPAAGSPAAGSLVSGDWLVSPAEAARLRSGLRDLVGARGTDLQPGVPVGEAVQVLRLPDRDLLEELVGDDLRLEGGRVVPAAPAGLPPDLARALDLVRAHLERTPYAAPDAGLLASWHIGVRELAALARTGDLLRLDETVVLLPGADDTAAVALAGLPQPFTTSQARQALGTSRRVALPLLAHLDRTGRTRRAADDRRSVTGGSPVGHRQP